MKICNTCKETKALTEFPISHKNKDGRSPRCNTCKEAKYTPSYHKAVALKNRFNMTLAQYDELFTKQDGVCAICHQPESNIDYRTGKVKALTVDHDHITGQIRSLLCSKHNRALGFMDDSIEIAQAHVDYLKSHLPTLSKPTIYFLTGQCGTGKTWVASQLSDKFTIASHDTHTCEQLVQTIKSSTKPVLYESPIRVSTFINKNSDKWDIKLIVIQEDIDIIQQRIINRGGHGLKGLIKRHERMKVIIKYYNPIFVGTSQACLDFLKSF